MKELSETLREEHLRYFLFGRGAYYEEFDYAPEDAPDRRIDEVIKTKAGREAREKMFDNLIRLEAELSRLDDMSETYTRSYDEVLREVFLQIAIDSAESVDDPSGRDEGFLKFLSKIEMEGMLFYHLRESGDSTADFFRSMGGISEGPETILTDRQVVLAEFVARTHDLGKLMGTLIAQIDLDHEVIYRKIIGKHLMGKRFKDIVIGDEPDDIDFILGVGGHHEDIFREEAFAYQAVELQKTESGSVPLEVAVARARSILHFIDIFGNAIRIENGSLKIVNEDAFRIRFLDLYRRHIKLPIVDNRKVKPVDWDIGKVTRPEWGQYGVAGLTWTFGILEDEWGVKLDEDLIPSVRSGILGILKESEEVLIAALEGKESLRITVVGEGENIEDVRTRMKEDLVKIKKVQRGISEEL